MARSCREARGDRAELLGQKVWWHGRATTHGVTVPLLWPVARFFVKVGGFWWGLCLVVLWGSLRVKGGILWEMEVWIKACEFKKVFGQKFKLKRGVDSP